MRSFSLLLVSLATACATSSISTPEQPPRSVRERLELGETRLLISPTESAGAITAARHTSAGWEAGIADLHLASGELVLSADDSGVTLERVGLALEPIEIPATVIGHGAQLTDVRVDVAAPVQLATSWLDDNESHGTAKLDLALTWTLTVDGSTLALGAPDLPPVPVELVLTGDGRVVHGELRVQAPGELWGWASLIKLEDLMLIVSAETY